MTITITPEQAAANLARVLTSILDSAHLLNCCRLHRQSLFPVDDEYGYSHLAVSRAQQTRGHEALEDYHRLAEGLK